VFRWINGTCAVLEPADARALREGVGFAMGHGMEPYSAAPAMMLADLVQLGEQGCRDACRGVLAERGPAPRPARELRRPRAAICGRRPG